MTGEGEFFLGKKAWGEKEIINSVVTHFTLCFVLVSSPFLFVVRSRFVFTMFELTTEDYYFFFYHEQLTVLHLLPIHKDYRYFYVYCVLLAVVVLSQSVFFERESSSSRASDYEAAGQRCHLIVLGVTSGPRVVLRVFASSR